MAIDPRRRSDVPEGWPPMRGPFALNWPPSGPLMRILFGAALLLLILSCGVLLLTGQGGFVEISTNEVAVVVNYMTGKKEYYDTPGYQFFLPFLQQVFKFEKSPIAFRMAGDKDRDESHVSKLTVRANDGSNFWFEELDIQYNIIPSQATALLEDSGPGDAFKKEWVRTYARSILRDEFGRFSAAEVVNNYSTATAAGQARLNEALRPHGIEVRQIITPKPKFDSDYEAAIEDRKIANQEVDKLRVQIDRLKQERERRLANVQNEMATKFEDLKGTLEAERILAEQDAVKLRFAADAYKIERQNLGEAARKQQEEQARSLTVEAQKEAEGITARVRALENNGEILVREALAQLFARMEFEFVPYRRDPSPFRIEHLNAPPANPAVSEQKGAP
ncbi:MAG: SPFH domain-containing protein [Planctomycetota bacterium]